MKGWKNKKIHVCVMEVLSHYQIQSSLYHISLVFPMHSYIDKCLLEKHILFINLLQEIILVSNFVCEINAAWGQRKKETKREEDRLGRRERVIENKAALRERTR